MLVLSRKKCGQVILTVPPSDQPQVITAVVVEIRGDKVRLGFEADREAVVIHRREVQDAIQRSQADGGEAAA